jgi:hypothetical protein
MLFSQAFYDLVALLSCLVAAIPLAEDGNSVNAMTPYHLNMTGKIPHI